MTVYYVNCKGCGVKVELERKPQGDNIATAFGATWTQDIRCGNCSYQHRYDRNDIESQHESKQI
jgi:DNA-directed RNA polymerase subunit RPC12/RpoP